MLIRLAMEVYVAVQQNRPEFVDAIAAGHPERIDWQTGRMRSAEAVEQAVKARLGFPPDASGPADAGPWPKA